MEFQDKVLKCVDCGADFIFTAGEQLFFHDKQFKNEPKRCKNCKSKRASSLGIAAPGNYAKLRPGRVARNVEKKPLCPLSPHKAGQCFVVSAFSSAELLRQPLRLLQS